MVGVAQHSPEKLGETIPDPVEEPDPFASANPLGRGPSGRWWRLNWSDN